MTRLIAIAILIVFTSCASRTAEMTVIPETYEIPGVGVPVIRIDREACDSLIDNGYNRPVTDEDTMHQKDEWYELFDTIHAALSSRWRFGIGDGDFFMSSDRLDSRMIGIEASKEGIINSELVRSVHKSVAEFKAPFCVNICDSWVYMKTRDGEPYPHFDIFVQKDRILVHTESDLLFDKIGARPAKNQ